jgi:hypothetical protein
MIRFAMIHAAHLPDAAQRAAGAVECFAHNVSCSGIKNSAL